MYTRNTTLNYLYLFIYDENIPYEIVRVCQTRKFESWMSVLASFQRHRCYRIYIVRSFGSPSCITLFGVLHYFLMAENRAVIRCESRDEIKREISRAWRDWPKLKFLFPTNAGARVVVIPRDLYSYTYLRRMNRNRPFSWRCSLLGKSVYVTITNT